MSLVSSRRGSLATLAVICALIFPLAAVTCGGNADQVPIPDASMEGGSGGGPLGGEGGSDGPAPPIDVADEPEPEPDAPPSVCPVVTPIPLTSAAGTSEMPGIVWTGSGYFVVWGDARSGTGKDVYGVLLNPDGTRLGGSPDVLLANTASPVASSAEVVAVPAPGTGFMVVFEDCAAETTNALCGVGAVLVGANGQPLGAPVTVSPPVPVQRRPYLATGHGKIYVTFRDQVTEGGVARTVARITTLDPATGMATGPGVVLDPASNGFYPHVATNPSQVAVAYQRDKPDPQIVLALLDPALANPPQEVVVRSGQTSPATNPVVQWNTTRWVVAWEDERGGEAAIFASVVTPEGVAMPAQQAYDENGNWPTIASGDGMTSLIGFYGYPGQRVFLARLEATGLLKPGQVVIAVGKFPAVAYNPTGGVMQKGEYAVVYQNGAVGAEEIMFARFECEENK